MAAKADDIKIVAEPQMDPNVCAFHVDRPLFTGIASCMNKDMADGSPLFEALFGIDGIRQVMVSNATVTIAKSGDGEWQPLAKKIGAVIREKLIAGGDMIDPEFAKKLPDSKELRAKVQAVLDADINPGLASHGGSVELIDVQGTAIFVTLSGGCQGCASASITLKHGIQQILQDKVPEVTEVVDVTDHAAGANPYY
jgi:Fe-S cluster biogenesis protein NfuA